MYITAMIRLYRFINSQKFEKFSFSTNLNEDLHNYAQLVEDGKGTEIANTQNF